MQFKKALRIGTSVAALVAVAGLPFVSLDAFGHGRTGETLKRANPTVVDSAADHAAIDKYVKRQ